jgi:hypothetical protein
LSGKYSNLLISNKLNLPKGTYFVKTIDNIGVFSESEETIDQLLKEIEIGKTWLYNEEELNLFRQNLPKSVSFRSFSKLVNKSLSVLGNKLIETQVKYKSEKLKLNTDLEYISISINGKVRDFKSFPGKGNIVCLTEDGTIIGIENGIKTWKKGMEDKPIGSLQIVKSKEKEYLVATGSKSIHIIDRYGKYLDSYPLKWTKSEFVCASNAFINKGQILVGAITSTNHLVLFNSSGKLSKEIEIREMTGISEIDFFSVDSKMHVSIKCSDKILIYNVDEKKIVKQIEITNSSVVSDVPNFSIISFTKSGKLIQLKYPNDIEEHTSDINSDIIIEAQSVDSNIYTISLSGNQAFVSKNGKELLFEKDFANSRIISGAIFKNSFKETYFAVVDGMENGVYLYDEKGRMYVKGKIEGSNKVTLNQSSGYSVVVTTIIDGYMIQYLVK